MIKMFNEYNSNSRIGKQVSSNEFMAKKGLFKMSDFSQSERKSISDISKSRGFRVSISDCFAEFYTSWLSFELVKYEDDWFTLIVTDKFSQNTYYICDEFDEAVGLLNSSL